MGDAIKLIVMGQGGVGKSALTLQFVQGKWVERYDPTIQDQYSRALEVDGRAVQVEILDTAGQEEYHALRDTFMHTGDGFILVYAINDDATFANIIEGENGLYRQIKQAIGDRDVPFILVGNKADIVQEDPEARAVAQNEATKWLSDHQEFLPAVHEVSAKTNDGVSNIFIEIVRKVREKNSNAGTGSGSGGVFGASGGSSPSKKKKCVLL
jgi:small GTP-binding protein